MSSPGPIMSSSASWPLPGMPPMVDDDFVEEDCIEEEEVDDDENEDFIIP